MERNKKNYNKGRKNVEFGKNDLVLLKNSKPKGEPKWLGTFRVDQKINNLNYAIGIIFEDGSSHDDTVHVRRKEKYKCRKNKEMPEEMGEIENTDRNIEEATPKKKRGRPKNPEKKETSETEKSKRGTPRKTPLE